MILIADSGSTKTIWAVIDHQNNPFFFNTEGYNPYHISSEKITVDLQRNLPRGLNSSGVSTVYFFGAGCAGEKNCGIITKALNGVFSSAAIEVESDIHGASLALFGKAPGLTCIIGTGSSSAVWNGNHAQVMCPSLGYVLGDEGSGASLGIRFLKKYLRKEFSHKSYAFFKSNIDLSDEEILTTVYREADTKRFLASFVPLLSSQLRDPIVKTMIQDTFEDFIRVFISSVPDYKRLQIGFCGSPAFYFQDILGEELDNHGLSASKIIIHPMDGLVEHFLKLQ